MKVYTSTDEYTDIPYQGEQEPLIFEAQPNHPEALANEMTAHKDKFPLIENFELVVHDHRQSDLDRGYDVDAYFVNKAKNEFVTYWEMYHLDTHPLDMHRVPVPKKGELLDEMEMGYRIVMATDDHFVYIAHTEEIGDNPLSYTRYCKIPLDTYKAEWQAFVDWYHAHPEKRSSRSAD